MIAWLNTVLWANPVRCRLGGLLWRPVAWLQWPGAHEHPPAASVPAAGTNTAPRCSHKWRCSCGPRTLWMLFRDPEPSSMLTLAFCGYDDQHLDPHAAEPLAAACFRSSWRCVEATTSWTLGNGSALANERRLWGDNSSGPASCTDWSVVYLQVGKGPSAASTSPYPTRLSFSKMCILLSMRVLRKRFLPVD